MTLWLVSVIAMAFATGMLLGVPLRLSRHRARPVEAAPVYPEYLPARSSTVYPGSPRYAGLPGPVPVIPGPRIPAETQEPPAPPPHRAEDKSMAVAVITSARARATPPPSAIADPSPVTMAPAADELGTWSPHAHAVVEPTVYHETIAWQDRSAPARAKEREEREQDAGRQRAAYVQRRYPRNDA